MNAWQQGIRIMAYLKPDAASQGPDDLRRQIEGLYGVAAAEFIPKDLALERLKIQMKRQSAILDHMDTNPLPDAFEVRMSPSGQSLGKIEALARELEKQPGIESVEYGQLWLERFSQIFNLFRLAGYAMGALFFMASVFIVANTVRLVLYSRQEEVKIMRLVGASDGFIKIPFYIEGIVLGGIGGLLGIGSLYTLYWAVSINFENGISTILFTPRFLPLNAAFGAVLGTMVLGWLGSYLSLKQFLTS